MKPRLTLLTALLLVPLAALPAAEIAVGPSGFKTIAEGVAALKARDTLTILPGEYHESIELKKLAGTRDAPITIRAQRVGTVLLRGDVEVAGWEAVAGLGGVFAVSFVLVSITNGNGLALPAHDRTSPRHAPPRPSHPDHRQHLQRLVCKPTRLASFFARASKLQNVSHPSTNAEATCMMS
jgi:hypothetical protein